ncbi:MULTISPECIES: tRNA pseudouridine(38-40) synthase TruA [Idiomarina]|uniref:tRNA pseudouridine(38-40) synthase TruA n=1 Tax=Idiomarina TaxID=135575 RepID=UPI00129A49C9|nr:MULTISPECIES: tRNA pseudouridine(38-40) synthase TruA [Idiomarina]MRJ41108.1 tRNA pseudouridine(38-40) synthase TruA [Idiomarina sp. FeN1]NCU56273.1 tRNA pseudouridine(38-40) synthase TruA [Idiomarina sp. FenA--70]NCU59292.1 tRNA pseudouridine(38-40) synthase TruA [Idiomarina sp. FenBw--71]UUN12471.1 tRNA pseudouridine(38-40) synthase TruA [Idiomarina loihiensis]
MTEQGSSSGTTRIALGIEYDGSAFYGWQRQREVISVQQVLEQALSKVANHPVEVTCAGRTDAGVHATGQVVHFDCQFERAMPAWTMGVNSNLPATVAVRWAQPVADDFNARFSATGRRYRYIIANGRYRPGILGQGLSHYHQPLDVARMHDAAQGLLGEHDFSSFRAAQCQSHSPNRCVTHIQVQRLGDFVVVDIAANAFLHHMVRNIVGTLLEVGKGSQAVGWPAQVLARKDRTQAAATAKAEGLYLVQVDYPAHFNLPQVEPGPLWLPSAVVWG